MRLVGSTVVVISLVALFNRAGAGEADRTPARACVPAAIEDVHFPDIRMVDEIRVQVSESSPHQGAARVEVLAEGFDRVVHVLGRSSRALHFEPALRGDQYRITLDPVFRAPADACVERVELRSHGSVVAVIQP